jgi:hypothetical protein
VVGMMLLNKISLLSLFTASVLAVAAAPAAADVIVDPNETTVTGGPAEGSIVTDPAPTFTFESTAVDATFACRIAGRFASFPPPFADCSSPFTANPPLDDGVYRFEVYARSLTAGDDSTPAQVNFTVDAPGGPDLTPPSTTITDGPADGSTITVPTATFSFQAAADASKVSFLCSVDAGALESCRSPFTTKALTKLANGQHTFSVRGIDQAGNLEDPAETRTFNVAVGAAPPPPSPSSPGATANPPDTTGPTTSIESGPKKHATKTKARFKFSANEPATFECRLAGKKSRPKQRRFSACHSPTRYAHLKPGKYAFKVRGTDRAGNVGDTVRYSWKVRKQR